MPIRRYSEISAASRESWSPEAQEMASRLDGQLNAERGVREVFGARIVQARKDSGLTQPQLAQRAGVQQGDLSRIERGLGNPTRDTLIRIAEALGMELTLQPRQAPGD